MRATVARAVDLINEAKDWRTLTLQYLSITAWSAPGTKQKRLLTPQR
jgi:hypothetical protein